jgi:hypothetical protein
MIILSLDQKNKPASETDIARIAESLEASLAVGCYKNEIETSLVTDNNRLFKVMRYAKEFNQESILLTENHGVFLIYLKDLSKVRIGKRLVSSKSKPNCDAWTLHNGLYYSVEG